MKVIILAGGSGSRLWPLSREMTPKQLMKIEQDSSLLQNSLQRVLSCEGVDEIIAVANIKNYGDVKMQLKSIDKNVKVIAEPSTKNTAPAIASALSCFKPDDTVLIVPSDHLIHEVNKFAESINSANNLVQEGYIVTFGVMPYYPETGYGYIKTSGTVLNGYKVEKFIEKPDISQAVSFFKSTNYYWNGGIFMAKVSTLIEEYEKYAPEIYESLKDLTFTDGYKIEYSSYQNIKPISIDYAIMEKSDKLALVELLSDWKDVGSWQSLYEVKQKDINGNVISGNVITNDVKNSFIYSQKELVAVSGLDDVIIVETEDAILACNRKNSQGVKEIVNKLKMTDSETLQLHKTMFRPWGYYTCMNSGEGYLTKTICVMPKQKLSLQSHAHRSEHWVVLEGTATVILGDDEHTVEAGDSIDIPVGVKHSLQNHTDMELKIIEVQKGDYLSEDDIVRYSDIYGRV